MTDLPVACRLDPADLAARRDALLPGLVARAVEREDLTDGVRWRFAPSGALLEQIARVVETERQCCPFLHFDVTAEPGGGPIRLTVTGPTGTHQLLDALSRA